MISPYSFTYIPVQAGEFEIATWQHLTNASDPIHIYIEGDGYAYGRPTRNPTPRKNLVRNLVARDNGANVAYIARPCQYIKSPSCDISDWTDGRFSTEVLDSMYTAIKIVAKNRPIILIGYSGGAMISGIIINENPDINVQQWITIAGVLNHKDWTSYFGDTPLYNSKNMNKLPNISQTHYVAEHDKVVPIELSKKWTKPENMIIVPNATHNRFPDFTIKFHTDIDKRN